MIGGAQIWAAKKQAHAEGRRVWEHIPPPPPPPPREHFFLKMRCLDIVSEAVFESKMPPVLPAAFGKQNY